ncbi:MAG: helix-turn-helix transcriptional regulator, partial [Chloroflexi bacterium]|nr:helix-turn-helix transcriptional regulator [Chloroflexota bacterium]
KVIGAAFTSLGGRESLPVDSLTILTERERAVALAVAEGRSNKEVARLLDITERTVKAHLGAAFRKLGVRDRMQLVLKLSRQDEKIV